MKRIKIQKYRSIEKNKKHLQLKIEEMKSLVLDFPDFGFYENIIINLAKPKINKFVSFFCAVYFCFDKIC